MDILDYLKVYHQVIGPEDQLYQVFQPLHMMGSADSVVIKEKMKTGLYSLTSDCKPHTPFEQLPISESDEGNLITLRDLKLVFCIVIYEF